MLCQYDYGRKKIPTHLLLQSSEAEDDQHTQVCELVEIENISSTVFILWGSAGASSCLKSGAWCW